MKKYLLIAFTLTMLFAGQSFAQEDNKTYKLDEVISTLVQNIAAAAIQNGDSDKVAIYELGETTIELNFAIENIIDGKVNATIFGVGANGGGTKTDQNAQKITIKLMPVKKLDKNNQLKGIEFGALMTPFSPAKQAVFLPNSAYVELMNLSQQKFQGDASIALPEGISAKSLGVTTGEGWLVNEDVLREFIDSAKIAEPSVKWEAIVKDKLPVTPDYKFLVPNPTPNP